MFHQCTTFLLLSAIGLLAVVAQAETLNVRLVVSGSTPPYQQFSTTLKQALAASKVDMVLVESLAGENGAKPDLVIAAGMKATQLAIAEFDVPVLSVMIPRMSYEMMLESHPVHHQTKTTSAIYLDQPWERRLNFIQTALPGHKIVGLLYSPDANITLPRLPPGMSLNAQSARSSEDLFTKLESILNDSDVLLVVSDSGIYNSNNVRNILLTSYRHKVPLIGISQAYVNAGALGAVFSTPEQLAEQTARVIASFARNRRLPEPQYPVSFSVALNQQVARSLGIVLSSPEEIHIRMEKMEQGK